MGLPSERLLEPRAAKPRLWFGYLPVWSECVPLNPDTGRVDSVRCVANVVSGCIIGVRQTLSAIVSATLVFTSSGVAEVTAMFPFGISMMWYSTLVGSAWYAAFGRLQYNTNATQEVCAILYSAMAQTAARALEATPERIPATVLALIMVGTVFSGLCSVLLGKLGVGRGMLAFPVPVTSGFLGTIGFFLVRTALQVTSGVRFLYFYPEDLGTFLSRRSLAPVACLLSMVALMRYGPPRINRCFPESKAARKLSALFCQLAPLLLFYLVLALLGIPLEELSDAGWTYPAQGSQGFTKLWTTYDVRDADWDAVLSAWPQMVALVLMSVLCTMTGVLGITGKFPSGPDGDPAPHEVMDFDTELTTVGLGCVLTGLSNGVVTFHRLGSSVQLRLDGGTHRLAVLSSSAFVGCFFFSGAPLGHFIPKWFLGGLFMGSGISFLQGSLSSYKSLPLSQYAVTVLCVLTAAFSTPVFGIGAGLALSIVIFLWDSSQLSPVGSASLGGSTVSRTKRPYWELRTLRREGDRVLLLYLQGHLFFGSGQSLAASLVRAVEASVMPVRYCVLSFAKVPSMDSSAAEQLSAAVRKVALRGCKVCCCRMAPGVFETLSAAKIIESPDRDLRDVLELFKEGSAGTPPRGRSDADGLVEGDSEEPDSPGHLEHLGLSSPRLHRVRSFRPLGLEDHDAFDHETDALDYCADQLLREFCYGSPGGATLEPFMQSYRTCCERGERLSDEVFERMSMLPPGSLQSLRPFCEVLFPLVPGTALSDDGALFFILGGSLSYVEEPGAGLSSGALPAKGFHGRGGKRMRKRYPPGNIVGGFGFCLRLAGRLVDPALVPKMVVSGKFATSTELWVLKNRSWEQLPEELRRSLRESLVLQLADERQHTLLCGE